MKKRKHNSQTQNTTGMDYLFLALYAFAGIGLELLLAGVVEPMFGMEMGHYTVAQSILHWTVTCALWAASGVLIIWLAKTQHRFDLWNRRCELQRWQWVAVAGCFLLSTIAHYVDWNGWKPFLEYQRLGFLQFVFQYFYYLFEAFLISLIIVFGQEAGEARFHRGKIPYGGIILALTWGSMHTVSRGSSAAGFAAVLNGLLYGVVYLLVEKDYHKALPLICMMFLL